MIGQRYVLLCIFFFKEEAGIGVAKRLGGPGDCNKGSPWVT